MTKYFFMGISNIFNIFGYHYGSNKDIDKIIDNYNNSDEYDISIDFKSLKDYSPF